MFCFKLLSFNRKSDNHNCEKGDKKRHILYSTDTITNNNNGKTVKKEISRFLMQRTFTGKLATVKELEKQQ
jgi:hypothetical protein